MKKLLTFCLCLTQVGQIFAQDFKAKSFGEPKPNHESFTLAEMRSNSRLRGDTMAYFQEIANTMNEQLMYLPQARLIGRDVINVPLLNKDGTWHMYNIEKVSAEEAADYWHEDMISIYLPVDSVHAKAKTPYGSIPFDREIRKGEWFMGMYFDRIIQLENVSSQYIFNGAASTCQNPLQGRMVSYPVGQTPYFPQTNTVSKKQAFNFNEPVKNEFQNVNSFNNNYPLPPPPKERKYLGWKIAGVTVGVATVGTIAYLVWHNNQPHDAQPAPQQPQQPQQPSYSATNPSGPL